VNANSFTAGADYRTHAATMTGFKGGSTGELNDIVASNAARVLETDGTCYLRAPQFNTGSLPLTIRPYDFHVRVLSGSPIPEMEPTHGVAPSAPRSSGMRGRVIGLATAKSDIFVVTVNADHMIGVIVVVDLERGVPTWKVIAGSGVFTGSFIITL
jgi:hypothetical protein